MGPRDLFGISIFKGISGPPRNKNWEAQVETGRPPGDSVHGDSERARGDFYLTQMRRCLCMDSGGTMERSRGLGRKKKWEETWTQNTSFLSRQLAGNARTKGWYEGRWDRQPSAHGLPPSYPSNPSNSSRTNRTSSPSPSLLHHFRALRCFQHICSIADSTWESLWWALPGTGCNVLQTINRGVVRYS